MKKLLLIGLLAAIAMSAQAIEPKHAGLWAESNSEGAGHGVLLEYNAAAEEFAILWFNYHFDGDAQVWFISDANCLTGEPCRTDLFRPHGTWMGDAELGELVGWIEIEAAGDELLIDWFFPGLQWCQGISTAGILLRRCTGPALFTQITSPRSRASGLRIGSPSD